MLHLLNRVNVSINTLALILRLSPEDHVLEVGFSEIEADGEC